VRAEEVASHDMRIASGCALISCRTDEVAAQRNQWERKEGDIGHVEWWHKGIVGEDRIWVGGSRDGDPTRMRMVWSPSPLDRGTKLSHFQSRGMQLFHAHLLMRKILLEESGIGS